MPLLQRTIIGFCLFILSPTIAWASNDCPPFKPPTILVHPFVNEPGLDTSLNLASIKSLTMAESVSLAGSQHEIPVGLTAAKLRLDTHFEVLTQTRSIDGATCAQISQLVLTLGFDDTTVYLARELPYGSCSYQTVLGHEMRHVGIDRELVQSLVQILPPLLRTAVNNIGVVRATSTGNAQKNLRAQIDVYMDELSKNIAELRQRQQEPVDSQDEYSRLSNSCNGELRKLIESSLR